MPSPVTYRAYADLSYDPFGTDVMTGSAIWNTGDEATASHRYALGRTWTGRVVDDLDLDGTLLFVMLNPSTATADVFSPTIRRCAGYCLAWGFREMRIGNLFAYRATKPADMKAADDPVGPDNDAMLKRLEAEADLTVCGWGNHGTFHDRGPAVLDLLDNPHALTMTGAAQPGHPLYLKKDLLPKPVDAFDAPST